MPKVRNILCFLIIWLLEGALAAPSITLLVSKIEHLPLRQAAPEQLVGRFLVNNPSRTPFTVLITFEQGCKIQHFTTQQALPLQSVTLSWNNGTTSGSSTLYHRTGVGNDCQSVLEWTPPDPTPEPYATTYQVSLYTQWNQPGQHVALAGIYNETIHIVAIESPIP